MKVPLILREVVREASCDHVGRLAAALAFFTVFSLPALLVLVVAAAGATYDHAVVEGRLVEQVQALLGTQGARTVEDLIRNAARPSGSSAAGQALGALGLVFGALGFFLQIQDALNAMWAAAGNARRKGLVGLVVKRLLSLGMILVIALLVLASLACSALLSAFGDRLAGWISPGAMAGLLLASNTVVSLLLLTLLFAAVYRFLPDLKIEWREVWVGAAATAALFLVGKAAIGFYLAWTDLSSLYGAAGSIVVILLWIYYSALVVLLGAEFTQVYARLYGPRRAQRAARIEGRKPATP